MEPDAERPDHYSKPTQASYQTKAEKRKFMPQISVDTMANNIKR